MIQYNNHRERCITFLTIYSKNNLSKYSAEDIFQDGYFLYYKNIDKINSLPEDEQYRYIKTILKNLYLQQYNYNSRSKSKYFDKKLKPFDLDVLISNEYECESNKLDTHEIVSESHNYYDYKLINSIISESNNNTENILLFIEGYNINEICKMTGKKYHAVYQNLERIKEELSKILCKKELKNKKKD